MAIRPDRHALLVGEELAVRITGGVNDGAAVSGTLRVTVTDCRGAVMGERELSCSLEEGIGDLLEWRLALAGAPGRCVIRAAFGDDEPVANETSVYLLEPSGQRLPERPPALFVDDSRLAGHLRAGGAVAAGFSPETATDLPVVVDLPAAGLEPAEHLGMQMSRLPAGPVLPFDLVLFPAIGTWVPCGHVVTEHACFAGLPAGGLMEQEYQNVLPQWCIVAPKSRWIGGNITCGWYRGQKHKQNFQGVSAAFDGAELTELAHGRGRYVICQYRIVPHLGSDPVADRLLANLLRWVGVAAR